MTGIRRRKFKGYAALDERGNLLWGTIRTTAEAAQELHDRFNPDPTGEGRGESIVEVNIYISN